MTKAGVVLAGLLLALSVLVPGASAVTRTVHLTADGPTPKALTIKAGDRVTFVNDDTVPHQVRSEGPWQFDSGALPPGQTSAATPALTAPGTYRYSDVRGIIFLPQTFAGTLTVPAPKPSPSPSRTVSPTPHVTPSATRTTAPTPSPTPTPTPSTSPTPSPTPSPSAAVVPTTPPPSPSPTPSLNLLYGEPSGLVQSSPHRYGLPALLAGVAIGGVLSLMGRYLLSLPEGRRTGS